jgi:hypothetical protein
VVDDRGLIGIGRQRKSGVCEGVMAYGFAGSTGPLWHRSYSKEPWCMGLTGLYGELDRMPVAPAEL